MGMTIDGARNMLMIIENSTESLKTAIEIMRKYQKIQNVMDSRPNDDAKSNSKALSDIEVIMYGDNN